MRITSLALQNVGVFDTTLIEFPDGKPENSAEIHLFTGANGSGKSTILYALAGSLNPSEMLKNRMRTKDENSFVISSFSNDQQVKIAHLQQSNFSFSAASYPFPQLFNAIRGGVISDAITFDFAMFAYSGNRAVNSAQLTAIQEITQSPFANALAFYGTVNPAVLIQWIANTNSRIANAFYKGQLERVERLKQSIQRIESAIAKIIDKPVEFVFQDEPKLDVTIRIAGQETTFDVLPDGLKSIVSWIADLLMRLDRINWTEKRDVLDQNFILFLDEIEIHLHPAWQRKILPVVQELFPNAQIFIATHSPFVIGSVSGAWVYRLTVPPSPVVTPVLTNSASSVEVVLQEIFGVEETFGEDVEKSFSRFYELREQILRGDHSAEQEQELVKVSEELAMRSEETNAIISREIRQLQRILGRPLKTSLSEQP